MAKTIHGWDVIPDGNDKRLRLFTIPGAPKRRMRLRKDVGPYLVSFVAQYHKKIRPIDTGVFDDWAWAPVRKGNASSKISDHSGGVAVDLNATAEGSQSKSNTWWKRSPVKYWRMRRMLKRWKLLEWGGDYKTFYDPMHITFKYGVTVDDVKAEMKRMGITALGHIK